ncbi:FkbM family methyltransferase [Bradyrhizobium sp. WYCCWR 13023]|uniref:FkbM family methyltransferase n=1 Tax=Bradyrhizobium zhengyangense TaxID=2911009 RepID=A0A9X1UER7_9BRAD|nr:FkbM family methyltransferase [Bradyrhizobium zhengyangense]MCG2632729.1 FkbM family methyltransferase [Bradyrhizobium zhengyangense]
MNRIKQATISLASWLLPMQLKNSLFHLSYHLAPAEFEAFSHLYSFAPNMKFGLEAMARRGFTPRHIIDVGAYQGHWSAMARSIWPDSAITMIEPNASKEPACARVAHTIGARLYELLLGAAEGKEVEFNVMASGSSVLSERSPLARTVERHRLTTLDALLGQIAGPALLKIDAQGYELEILKGAGGVLNAVEAILLEVATIEINEGAPLLHDVIAQLKELGFVTYDILEIHRRPLDRALNQIDIIFIRESSPLIADKRHFADATCG